MREQPDDGTVVGRLLAGTEGWTDATPTSVPASWRSLLDLDAPSLDAEATDLLAGGPSGAIDVSTATTSAVADVVERHLDAMRASGSYSDVADVVIDVTVDPVDPHGFDTVPFELLGADPIGEMALVAVEELVDPVDASSSGILDPFFDLPDPFARDPIVEPRSEPADEPADELVDDITGGVSGPVRSVSHDPFDTIAAVPDPDRDAGMPWVHDDTEPIDLTEEPFAASGAGGADTDDDGDRSDIPDDHEVDG